MTLKTTLVLASNSPRRRQLLALGNWDFTCSAANVDETQRGDEAPDVYVKRLAHAKAFAVRGSSEAKDRIIIGSDTAVVDGELILGKPVDAEDAARMLKQLRGHVHQVYTAVAFHRVRDSKTLVELCVTDVPMRWYTDDEIEAYIRTGDPLDKAGAYAIQHPDFRPVDALHGCYASVMGLPMCHVARALHTFDLEIPADLPEACRDMLNYDCPVSGAILRNNALPA